MTAQPTPDPQGGTDPGWLRSGATAPIAAPRRIHLAVTQVVVLLAVVIFFVMPVAPDDGAIDPLAWILVAVGLAIGVAGVVVGRRPLTPDGAHFGAFVQRHFLAIGLTEIPALLSFVAAFVGDAGFLYLIGAVGSLIALTLVAPTDARLRADDQALQRQGVATSVRAQAYGADPAA